MTERRFPPAWTVVQLPAASRWSTPKGSRSPMSIRASIPIDATVERRKPGKPSVCYLGVTKT